jgi:sarcosine oxidase
MPATFDVIVAGLGAMGSAACYQLAKRGKRVLGLDRYSPPHTLGSSHGQTRIIREAYFEDPLYVPLVQRAYELWAELEREAGRKLFQQTGGLMIGRPQGMVVSGAKRSALEHKLSYEVLSSAQVSRRFPALRPDEEMAAVWEPRAGILFPEACVESHLALARKHGAVLGLDEVVLDWKPDGTGILVKTVKGEYRAGALILAVGAWAPSLLAELSLPLKVERQVLYWFRPRTETNIFRPENCPIYLWEYAHNRTFYGFPDLGEGVKVARHHEGKEADPNNVFREVVPEEIEAMRELVRRFLPEADGALNSATVCLYTNTPDHHFLIDKHPAHSQVVIASPCSGHGFKFSSAIGEVSADLALEGKSRFDLSLFRLKRFS